MVTARNVLDQLVAGVSTRANLLSYFNSNLDIIDAALAKCNWVAATDPGVGDDLADGYVVGSWWWNVTGHRLWQCESASAGAAVWRQLWPALAADATTTVALAGRAGGQTIEGDTASGGNLTLSSTHHATKGKIMLGSLSAYDQVSGRLGIGTTSPETSLHIKSNGSAIQFEGTDHFYIAWYPDGFAAGRKGFMGWAAPAQDAFSICNEISAADIALVTTSGKVNVTGNIYISGDCSALTFTDRTKGYTGDAVTELNAIKTKLGELDHSTLPAFAKSTTADGKPGRDLGAMISILTVAVQQLTARIVTLEAK